MPKVMAKKKKYYSLGAYWSYIKRYKFRFVLVVLISVVSSVALAIIPIFIGRLVSAMAETPVNHSIVYRYAGALIACSVGHHIAWHISQMAYLKLLISRNNKLGDVLFRAVIKKPYPYFVGKFTGKISAYVADISREYTELMWNVCYNYLDMLIKVPTIALIMFSVNIYTGIVFLSSLIVMFMVGRKTIKPAQRAEKKFTDKNADLNGYIIDVISNFVSVKAFRKTSLEAIQVAEERDEVIKAAQKSFYWNSMFFWLSMGFLMRVLIWPGTILLNIWLYLNGNINLTQITTFTTALVIFSDYVWGVIWNISMFNLRLARVEEAYQYLFGKRNVVEEYYQQLAGAEEGAPALQMNESLELRNLTFSYPDDKDTAVLEDIKLNLQKHEKIGVVGHSGGGKTTLIKVLLGYYPVSEESIWLDGQMIDNRRLVDLISYVPQDTSLFHRSIADNIAYGTEKKPERDEIELAAKRAHAHEFITETPKSYATMVGEKGIKLSMGQRQRIAIARAFLDDKPLLILDEATSALDSESEKLVQQALEDLWADKTVIAIAHRLSTLRHMDRIVVMDRGKIIEAGTHKDLLKKRGHYYRLWQHQHEGLIGD
jgi:ATP-binding cassette, subfamily B, bacterial